MKKKQTKQTEIGIELEYAGLWAAHKNLELAKLVFEVFLARWKKACYLEQKKNKTKARAKAKKAVVYG